MARWDSLQRARKSISEKALRQNILGGLEVLYIEMRSLNKKVEALEKEVEGLRSGDPIKCYRRRKKRKKPSIEENVSKL